MFFFSLIFADPLLKMFFTYIAFIVAIRAVVDAKRRNKNV